MSKFSGQYTYITQEYEKFFAVDYLLNFKNQPEILKKLSQEQQENLVENCKSINILEENKIEILEKIIFEKN